MIRIDKVKNGVELEESKYLMVIESSMEFVLQMRYVVLPVLVQCM